MRSLSSKLLIGGMRAVTYVSLVIVFGIALILALQTFMFFSKVPPSHVFFSMTWSLQEASYGILPLLVGTFLVALIAIALSLPIALLASIYVVDYMPRRYAYALRPLLEVLTGIPTVVYGFLAIILVGPSVKSFGQFLGVEATSESALAAGVTMSLMLIPSMVSLLSDALGSVPASLRDGAYALGSTRAEVIWHIVLPSSFSDILGVVLLSLSRAIGETMIVVMAAGLAANTTVEPFRSVTTVTVQIVSILLGDQDYKSEQTLAAFMLSFFLFLLTLGLNVVALRFLRENKRQHE